MIVELILGYMAINSDTEYFEEIEADREQKEIELQNKIRKIQERLKYYGMQ